MEGRQRVGVLVEVPQVLREMSAAGRNTHREQMSSAVAPRKDMQLLLRHPPGPTGDRDGRETAATTKNETSIRPSAENA
jgi:hypothetical protein